MCIMLYPQKIQTEFGLMYTNEYIIFYKLHSISFDVKWCEQVKLSMNPNFRSTSQPSRLSGAILATKRVAKPFCTNSFYCLLICQSASLPV